MSVELSVIAPCLNEEANLAALSERVFAAVDAAKIQTELVLVDDGSTDDTRQRLEKYGDRIRYVHQKNRGLSGARNTGIREAKGEFVAFLDADDMWHPQKTAVQMKVALFSSMRFRLL